MRIESCVGASFRIRSSSLLPASDSNTNGSRVLRVIGTALRMDYLVLTAIEVKHSETVHTVVSAAVALLSG